jgi:ribosomal protein S18 acetylase RimI-like enzyme
MNTAALAIRRYERADEAQVIEVWERCGLVVPQNNPARDIERKVAFQPELFFVGTLEAQVVATIMAGYDGHRGWLNYEAVEPEYRRHGWGRQMVEHAVAALAALGCPKVNLQVRASNTAVLAFYERIGFGDDHAVSLGRRLVQDPPR